MTTITIMEGHPLNETPAFYYHDAVPSQPMETGVTALMDSATLYYFEPDRFDFFRDNGFQTTQFTLAYDSDARIDMSHPIPEPSTYAMLGLGFLAMFLFRRFKGAH